jgi:hypothetical protein
MAAEGPPTIRQGVIITFKSDADLEQHGSIWDRQAPYASFHRRVCARWWLQDDTHTLHRDLLLITFHPTLIAESDFGAEDTPANRVAWAKSWAKLYRIKEASA